MLRSLSAVLATGVAVDDRMSESAAGAGPSRTLRLSRSADPWQDPSRGAREGDVALEAVLRAGLWWHWRERGWTLQELATASRLPASLLLEIIDGYGSLGDGDEDWKRRVVARLAAGFGVAPDELLERGEAVLRPWRLCRLAKRKYDRLIGELSDLWRDPPAVVELDALMERYSTDDPAAALRRAEGDGLFDVEAPEYRGYPLPAAETFPDGIHPMDYRVPYFVAVVRDEMASRGWSEARLAAESGLGMKRLRAFFENREPGRPDAWERGVRGAICDALDLGRREVRAEGWKILEPLAADWLAAKFLEGAPRYEIPQPPRLMTPEEVDEFHRQREGRRQPPGDWDELSWSAFRCFWERSGWDAEELAERTGVPFWRLQRFLRRRIRMNLMNEAVCAVGGLTEQEYLADGYRWAEEGYFDIMQALYDHLPEVDDDWFRLPWMALARRRFEQMRERYGEDLGPMAAYRAYQADPDGAELELDVDFVELHREEMA